VGDLNTGARGAAVRRLRTRFKDARTAAARGASTATFPSTLPIRRLDHVFVGGAIQLRSIHVATGLAARRASDHLPLVVDFEVAAAGAEPSSRPAD
jgi:endonuclease/exonuclease/phosphatase family metal-dependent hydrolase